MDFISSTLAEIDTFCKKHSIPYAIFGGIAVIVYGVSRSTQDIDVNLLIDLKDLSEVGVLIEKEFQPRLSNPMEFFETSFVMPVISNLTKMQIDFIAGLTEFDKKVIKRSKRILFGETEISICSIEDLIIYKLFAARKRDLADAEEIIINKRNEIDEIYLTTSVKEFQEFEREDMNINLNRLLAH